MDEVRFELTKDEDGEIAKQISENLVAFNNSIAGESKREYIVFVARNSSGVVLGGIRAHTHRGWLYIHQLCIFEQNRFGGLGSKLVNLAEAEAKKRGCTGAYLDTFSFQAPKFYKKLGYNIYGELNDFPVGHKRLFLKKTL
jgi:GNAT superfamily N-acetyltransferase